MKRVIMQLETFGTQLSAERTVFNENENIVHEAVTLFAKHAPCRVGVFDKEKETRICTVELKVVGEIVP